MALDVAVGSGPDEHAELVCRVVPMLPGSLATGQRLPHVNPPRDAGNYVLRIAASLLLARFAILCLELAAVLCCVASFIELLCCAFELIVVMHF